MALRARLLIFILTFLAAAGGQLAGPWSILETPTAQADEILDGAIAAAIGGARARLVAGEYAEAIRLLRPSIEDEDVSPNLMAQGYVYRGIAHLELDQLVAALSDFGNALWLESLPMELAAQAHVHRARAYARLGRNAEARDDLLAAIRIAPNDPVVVAATRASGLTTPTAGEQPTGSLPKPGSLPQSGFSVQLAALVDKASARAEWDRLLGVHDDLLSGLAPRYEETTSANRKLIRLRAGPLASLEASETLCAKLRARGQDCFAVGH